MPPSYTFPFRIKQKDQGIFSWVIMLLILITLSLDYVKTMDIVRRKLMLVTRLTHNTELMKH